MAFRIPSRENSSPNLNPASKLKDFFSPKVFRQDDIPKGKVSQAITDSLLKFLRFKGSDPGLSEGLPKSESVRLKSEFLIDTAERIETDWLKQWAKYSPLGIALKDATSGREFTYSEFYAISQRLALHLREHYNVQAGDRVAVLATNEIEYFFLFYALQRLAAIMVPVNFRLTPREVAHILADSRAKLLILQRSFAGIVDEIEPSSRPTSQWYFDGSESLKEYVYKSWDQHVDLAMQARFDDPCMILYTSGTTGAPKGAIITHKMLFWNSVNTTLRLNLSQSDVCLSFLPFFHTGGWNVLNTPFLHRGAKIVFMPKFDANQVLELCEQENVTILFGVPTTMEMMRQSPVFPDVNLKSVRYAIVGGEPMPIPLIRIWAEKGIPVRQGFGMTEFGPNVFSLNEKDALRKIGSIGFPNFYIETKVVDDAGNEVPVGEIGELVLKGPTCTPGYWMNPKATQDTIRNGWLHTGDLVTRDEEDYYYVVGRKKDMYISGGENVYPTEIEQFLRSHPDIQDVAIVGVQDEKWGEVGRAFVVKKPGSTLGEQNILEFCQGRLAKYKTPRYVTFLKELPKGDSGKILKKALREITL
jgi:fatty-acyl-CoA synthase